MADRDLARWSEWMERIRAEHARYLEIGGNMATEVETVMRAQSLEAVVRWALERDLELRVVPMDEFTSDVVVVVHDELVLVFDTT